MMPKNIIRWLFDLPEYGSFDDARLYRRRERSRKVEIKTDFGWRDVPADDWYKFMPEITKAQSIRLPDRRHLTYTNKWRDKTGEYHFNEWVDRSRRLALEAMIRARTRATLNQTT